MTEVVSSLGSRAWREVLYTENKYKSFSLRSVVLHNRKAWDFLQMEIRQKLCSIVRQIVKAEGTVGIRPVVQLLIYHIGVASYQWISKER